MWQHFGQFMLHVGVRDEVCLRDNVPNEHKMNLSLEQIAPNTGSTQNPSRNALLHILSLVMTQIKYKFNLPSNWRSIQGQ